MRSWLVTLALLVSAPACADAPAGAWVESIAQANADADAALAKRNPAVAIRVLTRALAADAHGVASADLRVVHADLYFRLAELELERGYPATARTRADQGLALGTPDDLYTANLFIVRGRANEALDPAAAIDDYHRALVINEALLADLLEDL